MATDVLAYKTPTSKFMIKVYMKTKLVEELYFDLEREALEELHKIEKTYKSVYDLELLPIPEKD